jgi:hypothetical protein
MVRYNEAGRYVQVYVRGKEERNSFILKYLPALLNKFVRDFPGCTQHRDCGIFLYVEQSEARLCIA